MLPMETINSVFPSSVPVGKTSIGPMTLLHAVALEALGVEVTSRYTGTPNQVFLAAWVASLDANGIRRYLDGKTKGDEIGAWLRANDIDWEAASKAVDELFSDAFSTYVQPANEDGTIQLDDLPEGYGWPLEMAEMIAHEHGRPMDEVFDIPLMRVFGMVAVMRQRYGGKTSDKSPVGRDYFNRIRDKQFAEKMRILNEMKRQQQEQQQEQQQTDKQNAQE